MVALFFVKLRRRFARGSRSSNRAVDLLPKDLLDVADLALNFAAGLIRSAARLHVAALGSLADCFLCAALHLCSCSFNFIFRAGFHTSDSRLDRGEVVKR